MFVHATGEVTKRFFAQIYPAGVGLLAMSCSVEMPVAIPR